MKEEKVTIKYNNDLNDIQFGAFSSRELDLLFAVLNELQKELPTNCSTLGSMGYMVREYPFSQLRELMGLTTAACSNTHFEKRVMSLGDKLTKVRCFFDVADMGRGYMCLCPMFKTNPERNAVVVHFNAAYLYLLSKVDVRYTSFELHEYFSLKRTASKALYHKIKQYKMSGSVFYNDIDYFRQQMALPSTTRRREIISRIVEPAVDELKRVVPDLKLAVTKAGSSHEITGFTLTFEPTKAKPDFLRNSKVGSDAAISVPLTSATDGLPW